MRDFYIFLISITFILAGCGGDVSGPMGDKNLIWYDIQEAGEAGFTLTIERNSEQIAQYTDSAPFETPKIQVFRNDRIVAQFCTQEESSFQVDMVLNDQTINELSRSIEDGEGYCRPIGHTMDSTVDDYWN